MDLSYTYYQMCRHAKEIQALRSEDKWKQGDFFCDDNLAKENTFGILQGNRDNPYPERNPVWLPRVDQLLKLMKLHTFGLSKKGNEWSVWNIAEQEFYESDTPEQALLKRIMAQYKVEWIEQGWKKK